MLNEGQFGKDPASVCIYNGSDWTNYAFRYCNPPSTSWASRGTMTARHNGSFYFVSKNEPFVTEASADDLAFRSSLSDKTIYGQGRSIAVYDDKKAYFSAMNGLFEVGIAPLADGKRVFESKNGGGDVAVADGKVYFIDKKKLYVYDPATGAAPEEIGAAQTGFAAGEGTLWCGNATTLTRIDTRTATASTFPWARRRNSGPTPPMPRARSRAAARRSSTSLGIGLEQQDRVRVRHGDRHFRTFLERSRGQRVLRQRPGLRQRHRPSLRYLRRERLRRPLQSHAHRRALNSAGSVLETIDYSGHFWFPSKVFVL